MTKATVYVCAILGCLALAGCVEEDTTPSAAVLDLDRLAAGIGWQESFQTSVERREREISREVEQARVTLEAELEDLRTQYGAVPTESQKTQLAQFTQQANNQLQHLLNSGRRETADYRARLVQQFRGQVLPHAEEVAKERGFGIVLLKTDPVYLFLPEVDITGDVIVAMQELDLPAKLPEDLEREREAKEEAEQGESGTGEDSAASDAGAAEAGQEE
jgi:Skp family chaperone for outer membrane proteins